MSIEKGYAAVTFCYVNVFLVVYSLPFPCFWYCMYVRYVCIFVPSDMERATLGSDS